MKIMVTLPNMLKLLYIHGMGGGADSRIPSILSEELKPYGVEVVCRTYDFDPEKGASQIAEWVGELKPSLIVGESLGALHALRLRGLPVLLVSPALNAPYYFSVLSWLTFIPGVTAIYDRMYRPAEGDRQKLHLTPGVLSKYMVHRRLALSGFDLSDAQYRVYAFFGTRDHYRRSGIVSIRTWKKHFSDSFSIYEGTHFMEEEHVRGMLKDKILNTLNINM